MEFIPRFIPENNESEKIWLLFSEKERYMAVDTEGSPFLKEIPGIKADFSLYLGLLAGQDCTCLSFEEQVPLPAGMEWVSFRDGYRALYPLDQYPVSRGKQLQEWRRTHRFCGSCGTATELSETEHVQKCPSCGDHWYPRMAPAVIIRITKGEKILLAHNANFPEGLYSHIAGFVDPGETLEQAIHREVFEEVGLRVQNISYFASQSWPMPHSLMLAFTAEALDESEPVPDGQEILDARWFSPDALPEIPGPGSIAGRMLVDFLSEAESRPDHG
ncbi:NAD(+) diphosphatase [Oceanispirochaeta sp.]|uniref:NAD(+) diphosphatase n=1 Tax=Oceanispirochaeta sp. TaxID=2035350 RepID=UPI0026303AE6|nr:NAD(+) diphosphatase [Oceanispirochaeta sp.]MDA3955721.1 NAD(+) diphosphatase [Oceanispirochaeta sp.]